MNKFLILFALMFSVTSFATEQNDAPAENTLRTDANLSETDVQNTSFSECERATTAKFEGKKITRLSLDSDYENVKFKVRGSREERTSSCRAISGPRCSSFVTCSLSDDDHIIVIHSVTAGCVLFEYSGSPYVNHNSSGSRYPGFDICSRVGNAIYQHEGNCRDRDNDSRPKCDW